MRLRFSFSFIFSLAVIAAFIFRGFARGNTVDFLGVTGISRPIRINQANLPTVLMHLKRIQHVCHLSGLEIIPKDLGERLSELLDRTASSRGIPFQPMFRIAARLPRWR